MRMKFRGYISGLAVAAMLAAMSLPADYWPSRNAAAQTDLTPRLIISEYRLRGPGNTLNLLAESDEFVEIYNNSDFSHRVFADDGTTGYALVASDGLVRFIIPNGTAIPARGHFLGVNTAGYSIANYPAGNGRTATGDATYSIDIPDFSGLALFKTASPTNFNLANRLDAVGYAGVDPLYREGAGFTPLQDATGINEGNGNYQYSFYRDLRRGFPKDTGNNVADFLGVETFAYPTSAGRRLGAPGPENLSSPIQRSNLTLGLSDNFDDNSTDTSKWAVTGARVFERNQRLETTPPDATTGYDGYYGASDLYSLNLTNRAASVEVVQVAQLIYGIETYFYLYDNAAGNGLLFATGGGGFVLDSRANGVVNRTLITYDPAQHRFWRFRHDAATDILSFETSPDNINWTTQKKLARPFNLDNLQVILLAGKYTATTPASTAIFDNFEVRSNDTDRLPITPVDSSQPANAAPNQVSNSTPITYTDPTSGIQTSFPGGTISFRRTVTNNTGGSVTRLRFRIVDISTAPVTPGQADLRAITSTQNIVVTRTDGSAVTARPTTLEQPPMYRTGGGFNHTWSVALAQPLANGASISVQLLTGVRTAGASRLSVIVEALP